MKLGTIKNLVKRVAHAITSGSYEEFYRKTTKRGKDWRSWVGPSDAWEKVRDWQFEKLMEYGLEPKDKLLDVGCGVLRGGVPFIRYLDKGNYYGMDISSKALKIAKERIEKNGLEDKNPTVFKNEDLRFSDPELGGTEFDYILAQSVFTHLKPEQIEECLGNVGKVLKNDGFFLATYHRRSARKKTSSSTFNLVPTTNFKYPLSFFESLSTKYGLEVQQVFSGQPNGQELLEFKTRVDG